MGGDAQDPLERQSSYLSPECSVPRQTILALVALVLWGLSLCLRPWDSSQSWVPSLLQAPLRPHPLRCTHRPTSQQDMGSPRPDPVQATPPRGLNFSLCRAWEGPGSPDGHLAPTRLSTEITPCLMTPRPSQAAVLRPGLRPSSESGLAGSQAGLASWERVQARGPLRSFSLSPSPRVFPHSSWAREVICGARAGGRL